MRKDSNLAVDGARLWDSLMEMAKIGATAKGGVNRLTLTDLDRQSRDLFVTWCTAAGCTIGIDRMGSIFARRAGSDDNLPPVMVGSHLDTQPTGGKFDGALGVMAALEVVRSLNDLDVKTRHPVEIAMWTNEEGSRFAPAMVASGVFAGVFSPEYGLSRADVDGATMAAELARIGYAGTQAVGGREVAAFFELHIEQGPILEEAAVDVGVVTHANGQRWYEINITGVESHAGPTPMARRKDALLCAARLIEAVNAIGWANEPNACATCGMIQSEPNSRNVIPGKVFLTVDLRHSDDIRLSAMDAELRRQVPEIAARSGCSATLEQIFHFPVTSFDAACVGRVREGAKCLGLSHRDITSGAGHDAVYMARVAPTAMVFVPCIGGISHNEAEDMKPEWATAGANVLLHAVLETAGVVGR
jgi:N-carbamoyl-L-amino-acid hydrolase